MSIRTRIEDLSRKKKKVLCGKILRSKPLLDQKGPSHTWPNWPPRSLFKICRWGGTFRKVCVMLHLTQNQELFRNRISWQSNMVVEWGLRLQDLDNSIDGVLKFALRTVQKKVWPPVQVLMRNHRTTIQNTPARLVWIGKKKIKRIFQVAYPKSGCKSNSDSVIKPYHVTHTWKLSDEKCFCKGKWLNVPQ